MQVQLSYDLKIADLISVQAILVTLVGYPFDLVKTRPTKDCVIQTFKKDGILGFYKGGTMPLLSHIAKRPLQFTIGERIKSYSKTSNSNLINNYSIGFMTGSLGTPFGTPLQNIKVNLQTNNYKSASDYIVHTYKNLGLKGFYKGIKATDLKDSIFGMSFVGPNILFVGGL